MKVVSTKLAFHCPIFDVEERLVEHDNGHQETYWVVVKVPNVSTVALTNDKNIVFISLARGNFPESLEIPGGKVESRTANMAEMQEQALRELNEETGFVAKQIEFLSDDHEDTGWSERSFHTFIAWDLEPGEQHLEPGENIKIVVMSLEEVRKRITDKQFPEFWTTVLADALTKFSQKGLI